MDYYHGIMLMLVFIPLTFCSLTDIFGESEQSMEPTQKIIIEGKLPQNISETEQIENLWIIITKKNAEHVCLQGAKEAAVKAGYSEGLVFGCTCTAQETENSKTYDCTISALDGSHPVSLACIKSEEKCSAQSEQGTVSYTFEEINAILSQ